MKRLLGVLLLAGSCFAPSVLLAAETLKLQMPIKCRLNETCFLQQYPDMDAGPGATDPYCGAATYDGHKGTDIRVRYLDDIQADVPVLSAAAGTVLRLRDGVDDRLVRTEADADAIANSECGNGVIIGHEDGWETQYCHLKKGSVAVRQGDRLEAGEQIGSVGASGMAQFPHVHLTVRKDGETIDPFTGEKLGSACKPARDKGAALWSGEAAKLMDVSATQLLDAGLSSGAVDHQALAVQLPPEATTAGAALVGWANLINLNKGDRIRISVVTPGGQPFAEQTSDALDRNKATYSLFAGRKGAPKPGRYLVSVSVLRDGKPVLEAVRDIDVK